MIHSRQKHVPGKSSIEEAGRLGSNGAAVSAVGSRPGLPKLPVPQKQQYYLNEILNNTNKKKAGKFNDLIATGEADPARRRQFIPPNSANPVYKL